MTVSRREFFNETSYSNWKNKGYSNVLFQQDKYPTDFEFIELQDLQNYLRQQYVKDTASGFIGNGFKVVQFTGGAANSKVSIRIGTGWLTHSTYGAIKIELPMYVTEGVEEPTLDTASSGYLTFDFSTGSGSSPDEDNPTPSGSTRYDLIYLDIYRKQYASTTDTEILDAVLSETAVREKWFYEIKFKKGDTVIVEPALPATSHSGVTENGFTVKLAVLARASASVTTATIRDRRPNFSLSQNLLGKVVTVSPNRYTGPTDTDSLAGQYRTIPEALAGITPSTTTPYTILLLPGKHIYSTAITMTSSNSNVKFLGCGVDKTIVEFSEATGSGINGFAMTNVTNFEFDNMTIRFDPAYNTYGNLIQHTVNTASTVNMKIINCKIGDPTSTMDYGNINVTCADTSVLNLTVVNSEINNVSATKPCVKIDETSGTAYIYTRIYNSIIRNAKFRTLYYDTLSAKGNMKIYNTEIISNSRPLWIDGTSDLTNCLIQKDTYLSVAIDNTDYAVEINRVTRMYGCRIVGNNIPTNSNKVYTVTDVEFYGCYNDHLIICSTSGTPKFFNCSLALVQVLVDSEFYSCEFRSFDYTLPSLEIDTNNTKVLDCTFKQSYGIYAHGGIKTPLIKGCYFNRNLDINVALIRLDNNCDAVIEQCIFMIGDSTVNAIELVANTCGVVLIGNYFQGSAGKGVNYTNSGVVNIYTGYSSADAGITYTYSASGTVTINSIAV